MTAPAQSGQNDDRKRQNAAPFSSVGALAEPMRRGSQKHGHAALTQPLPCTLLYVGTSTRLSIALARHLMPSELCVLGTQGCACGTIPRPARCKRALDKPCIRRQLTHYTREARILAN